MATKRRKSSKITTVPSRKKCTSCQAPRGSQCKPRSLHELSNWELLRVKSALDAAAQLNDIKQCHLALKHKSSSCARCKSLHSSSGLIEDSLGCRFLAVALVLLGFIHGCNSDSDEEA